MVITFCRQTQLMPSPTLKTKFKDCSFKFASTICSIIENPDSIQTFSCFHSSYRLPVENSYLLFAISFPGRWIIFIIFNGLLISLSAQSVELAARAYFRIMGKNLTCSKSASYLGDTS